MSLPFYNSSPGAPATAGMPGPTPSEKNLKPWKYEGYPALAAWMASSDDCFVLRRFNVINTRIILDMQDEIVVKEKELEKLDQQSMLDPTENGRSDTLREDPNVARKILLKELRPKVKEYSKSFPELAGQFKKSGAFEALLSFEYLNKHLQGLADDFVASYTELRKRATAEEYQITNFKNWFGNREYAIQPEESEFPTRGGDVVPLVPKEKTFLRRTIEKIEADWLSKIFGKKDREDRVNTETIKYMSDRKIDAWTTVIIVLLGLSFLIGPLWILNALGQPTDRLRVITGFIVLFTGVLAVATVRQPFEVLAGTAAYAAVLMVFLQQQQSADNNAQPVNPRAFSPLYT